MTCFIFEIIFSIWGEWSATRILARVFDLTAHLLCLIISYLVGDYILHKHLAFFELFITLSTLAIQIHLALMPTCSDKLSPLLCDILGTVLKKISELFPPLIWIWIVSLKKSSFLVTVAQLFASYCWVIDDLNSPFGCAYVDVDLVEVFQILPNGQIQFKFRR